MTGSTSPVMKLEHWGEVLPVIGGYSGG